MSADPWEIPAFLRRTRPGAEMSLVGVKLGSAPLPDPADRGHREMCSACRRPLPQRRPLRIWFQAQLELAL